MGTLFPPPIPLNYIQLFWMEHWNKVCDKNQNKKNNERNKSWICYLLFLYLGGVCCILWESGYLCQPSWTLWNLNCVRSGRDTSIWCVIHRMGWSFCFHGISTLSHPTGVINNRWIFQSLFFLVDEVRKSTDGVLWLNRLKGVAQSIDSSSHMKHHMNLQMKRC